MKNRSIKHIASALFPRRWWGSPTGVWVAACFATLMAFDIVWCAQTTFRAMSDWMLYACNALVAFVLAAPFVATRSNAVQAVWMLVVDGVLVSNLMYCRTYYTGIPAESYLLAGNLSDFKASVADSLRLADLALPLIAAAGLTVARRRRACTAPRRERVWTAYAAALAAVTAAGLALRGGFMKEYDRLVESCYYTTCGVPTYTVAGHAAYTLARADAPLTDDQRQRIDAWMADHRRLLPHEPCTAAEGQRSSLVVILCESLESWVIGAEVDGKPITPFLNTLVADSTTLYAPYVLTQVGAGRSIDSQLLLDAGCLPMANSVYSMKYPANRYPSIVKAMARIKGARSALLTCDKPVVWNQEPIARAFGYDTILHRDAWVIDEQVGNPPKLSDGSFMRQSVEKLRRGQLWPAGQPVFLQFVTYSGHNPFRLPDALKDKDFSPSAERYPQRFVDYVTMAHYTDAQLRRLVDYIRSRPDSDSTLIVITGDHEGLAADRHALTSNPATASLVSPGQYTPFIAVNSPVAGRIDHLVGQIDLYPTLLNLMHLDAYHWTGLGTSILSPRHPRAALSPATHTLLTAPTLPVTSPAPSSILSPISPLPSDTLTRHLLDAGPVSDLLIRHNLLP